MASLRNTLVLSVSQSTISHSQLNCEATDNFEHTYFYVAYSNQIDALFIPNLLI
jgi:hypothetical protein